MRKYYLISIIFLSFTSQIFPQNWFPLDVGNRWDYFVHHDAGSMGEWYDSISIEIIDKQILSNNLEYYLFSGPFTWWYYPYPKYIREENDKIYFFDEEDSIDCFAFRFDLPLWSFYENCKGGQVNIYGIDTSFTLGYPDIHQNQSTWYDFSERFGIYHYFEPGLVNSDYTMKGCIISDTTYGQLLVSVQNSNQNLHSFHLSQNYPNPFNPITTISYQIPELSSVSLKVYDVLGDEVTTLINEEKPAGNYEVEFDGNNLTSGVYFYTLRAGTFAETEKMVLMK